MLSSAAQNQVRERSAFPERMTWTSEYIKAFGVQNKLKLSETDCFKQRLLGCQAACPTLIHCPARKLKINDLNNSKLAWHPPADFLWKDNLKLFKCFNSLANLGLSWAWVIWAICSPRMASGIFFSNQTFWTFVGSVPIKGLTRCLLKWYRFGDTVSVIGRVLSSSRCTWSGGKDNAQVIETWKWSKRICFGKPGTVSLYSVCPSNTGPVSMHNARRCFCLCKTAFASQSLLFSE